MGIIRHRDEAGAGGLLAVIRGNREVCDITFDSSPYIIFKNNAENVDVSVVK